MPDTFTPNLNLDLPPISAYDLFGAKFNANFTAIDTAALMLAGTPLSPTAPTTGQVLTFNGTSWTPETSAGGSIGGGGTANQVTYFTAATTVASSASLGWDPTNKILSVSPAGAGALVVGLPTIACVNDAGPAIMSSVMYGTGGDPQFVGLKARGTIASPQAVQQYDELIRVAGVGHDGSSFAVGGDNGAMAVYANETWSPTAHGSSFKIDLVSQGTVTAHNAITLDTGGAGGAARTGLGGNQSPAYAVDATGDANVSGVYRVGGTQIATTNLSDVSGAPTNGQVLTWNSTDSKWEPATPSGGGGAATGLATTGSPVGVGAAAPPTPGQALIATSATTATWQAVTASAAGSDTQVQFNSSGSLGASPNFTFTPSTSHLIILSASGACLELDPVDKIFSIASENLIGFGSSVGGVTVQVAGDSADGGDNAVFSAKSYGTTSRFLALHSAGSHASSTPPALGDTMMDVSAIGFASGFDLDNPGGSMKLVSTAAWSVADHGTSWEVDLCPTTGSTTQYPALFARVTGPSAAQVGVNTATPAYTLDVAGDANVSGVYRVGGNQIKTTNLSDVSGTPTNGQVLTWNSTDSKWEPATPSGGGGSSSGSPGDIQFAGATSGLFASNDANLFWDNTNHRLGIGTNSPTWPLTTLATGNQIGGTNYYAVGNVGSIGNAGRSGVTVGYNNSDGSGIISAGVSASNDLAFWSYNSGWAERVRFAASGMIGIGTAPAYTLDVSGSINFTGNLLYNGHPFLSVFQVTATYAAGITQSFSFPTSLTDGSIISMTPVDGGSANVAMTGFTPSVPLITGGVGTFTVTYTADPGSAPTVMIRVGGS